MFFSIEKEKANHGNIKSYFRSSMFQRLLIGIITIMVAFVIIETGAAPKKYKLNIVDKSSFDITAPRDIENKILTEKNRKAAEDKVVPVTKEIIGASVDIFKNAEEFIGFMDSSRQNVEKSLQNKGVTRKDAEYKQLLEAEQEISTQKLAEEIKKKNITLSMEQIRYIVSKASDQEISEFKSITRELITDVTKEDISQENLPKMIDKVQNSLQQKELNQELKNIGTLLIKAILKPNKTIDDIQTKERKQEARNSPENIVKILKDERIISSGEIVSEDKYKILEELNLLETTKRFDFLFAAGILTILLLMAVSLVLYMKHFCRDVLLNRNEMLIICIIILLTLAIARLIRDYSPLAIPIFIATMTISILLDLKLALMVNYLLTITILLMTKGDFGFLYMSIISGTFSAFLVEKANQRSKLSMTGLIIGLVNVLIIVCIGIINKSGAIEMGRHSLIAFFNGVISIVITVGMLPFWESAFNVITPLKLLELTNPNQSLLKRLLMEAPGTYHHSLMVGNLAEAATEAIGGNALLARVGAYYHDVGKLRRPNFFMENQMTENPHDKMTANLSTLVITSHTGDGAELARKNNVPLVIQDIIKQHHGTTLVAYFYHKAKMNEKGETVKLENFRYEGPEPSSKEAAVVMLADSVEAAVRSMMDKTEGKIEGLVRKIIKEKLDDGQLDLCDLTLKDLNSIAKAFMRVLSGFFHEREEYPEVKKPENEKNEEPAHIVKAVGQSSDLDERNIADAGNHRELAK